MRDAPDVSLARVQAATTPVGAVHLLGGVVEVRRRTSTSMSPGESPGSGNRRDGGVLYVVTLLGASRFETRRGVPCCALLALVLSLEL
jgi:hypothetical protein